MDDYKKSKEHLTNAALASPLAFLAGGPAGAVTVLGLGKVLDHLEDKDFERRQLEWAMNPNRTPNLTPEQQLAKINNDNKLRKGLAADIPQFVDAIEIRGSENYKNEKEVFINIKSDTPLQHTRTGIGSGEVVFYDGAWYRNSIKKAKAELHYNTVSFKEKFLDDYKTYKNKIKTYKIVAAMYKKGSWMYTIDNGKSYVVCL